MSACGAPGSTARTLHPAKQMGRIARAFSYRSGDFWPQVAQSTRVRRGDRFTLSTRPMLGRHGLLTMAMSTRGALSSVTPELQQAIARSCLLVGSGWS